jgi:hypothetical protein
MKYPLPVPASAVVGRTVGYRSSHNACKMNPSCSTMFCQEESKDDDIVFNGWCGGADLVDSITSSMFRDDNDEDNRVYYLLRNFFRDLEHVAPRLHLLNLSVDEHTFVPPTSKVEVSFDGEFNTIISSGFEDSFDEVKKKPQRSRFTQKRNKFIRQKKLRRDVMHRTCEVRSPAPPQAIDAC